MDPGCRLRRVSIVTLGCSKNRVDSEHLGYHLSRGGWEVSYDADPAPGSALIINTCGFILDAKRESIEYILRGVELRGEGVVSGLVVMGCLSARYPGEMAEELPEVDAWFGVTDGEALLRYFGVEGVPGAGRGRRLSTPAHVGYLKIAEGCDRGCAFCAIPLFRGRYRSFPLESLVREAEEMALGGVRELVVIAQETTSYGSDLPGGENLASLLRALSGVEGIEWVRLHYAYPHRLPEELVSVFLEEEKVCRYLDIPIQHLDSGVLRRMGRGHDEGSVRRVVEELRGSIPGLWLRTTLMVGFPGEDEAAFERLLSFVREGHFAHLGVFSYSAEEGTVSARRFADDVPEEVKEERRERLLRAQESVAEGYNSGLVGRRIPVILDGYSGDGGWVGRTAYDSPEVDGEVLVEPPDDAPGRGVELLPGDIVPVRILEAQYYDRMGRIEW